MANNELTYEGNLVIKDPVALFSKYFVTEKDIDRYTRMINTGKGEEAVDEFIAKYMLSVSHQYTLEMQRYLRVAETGEMERKDQNKMVTSVALLTVAMLPVYKNNFRKFIANSYAPAIFKTHGVTSPLVKRVILDNTVSQFMTLTESSMSVTQANVINHIRQMQKEMVVFNQSIKNQTFITGQLNREVALFKEGLRETFPGYYKAMEEGNILRDSLGRNVKPDAYAEMSTRTTILNVDRTSVETIAKIDRVRVVEYYKRDFRTVKEHRQICTQILSNITEGKSLLAMDQETAKVLGVLYIENAKAQGALGVNCRHSIKSVSNTFGRKIEKKYFRG